MIFSMIKNILKTKEIADIAVPLDDGLPDFITKDDVVDVSAEQLFYMRVKPEDVNVMPTTKCNLKCEYCLSSGKHAKKEDLIDAADDFVENIANLLKNEHPRPHMILSGGEITFMKDWPGIVKNLLANKVHVMMITNLAKIMDDAEIETLSSLGQILISIDTPDIELAKKFRSKTQLENIVYNIIRIRSYCAMKDIAIPPLSFHCTLGSQTIRSLPELVSMAHACGVPHVHVNEVTMHNDINFEYKPVTFYGERTRQETISLFNDAFSMANRLGVRISVVDGLIDAVQNPINENLTAGKTRLCFDPWKMLLFGVDGAIHTCCNGYPAVSNLYEVSSLKEIFFGSANTKCKTELLTGELSKECIRCTRRKIVDIDDFKIQLEDYLSYPG